MAKFLHFTIFLALILSLFCNFLSLLLFQIASNLEELNLQNLTDIFCVKIWVKLRN